jgi:hypothetical protein
LIVASRILICWRGHTFPRLVGFTLDLESGKHFSIAVTMNGTTLTIRWNWQKICAYGEVVCFVSAWAVGLLVALQHDRSAHDRPDAQTFASANDTLGIQANLSR